MNFSLGCPRIHLNHVTKMCICPTELHGSNFVTWFRCIHDLGVFWDTLFFLHLLSFTLAIQFMFSTTCVCLSLFTQMAKSLGLRTDTQKGRRMRDSYSCKSPILWCTHVQKILVGCTPESEDIGVHNGEYTLNPRV